MTWDRRAGLALIAVAGVVVLGSGLWFGHGWGALTTAGVVVAIGIAAGVVGERLARRR